MSSFIQFQMFCEDVGDFQAWDNRNSNGSNSRSNNNNIIINNNNNNNDNDNNNNNNNNNNISTTTTTATTTTTTTTTRTTTTTTTTAGTTATGTSECMRALAACNHQGNPERMGLGDHPFLDAFWAREIWGAIVQQKRQGRGGQRSKLGLQRRAKR